MKKEIKGSSRCAVLPKIKTQRLMLAPMGMAELERKIAQLEEGELRQAYREMLDGCKNEPENRLWYTLFG